MTVKYSGEGIRDNTDETKVMSFDVSGVTTNTTRTLTMPDRNVTIGNAGDLTGSLPAIDGSALTGLSDNTPSFGSEMSANTNVSQSTWTKIDFNTEQWDTDSAFDTTNHRFSVPAGEGGRYMFTSQVGLQGALDNNVTALIALYVNGSRDLKLNERYFGSSGARMIRTNSWVVNLSAGDYVELYYYHEDSQTLTLEANRSRFNGFKLAGV